MNPKTIIQAIMFDLISLIISLYVGTYVYVILGYIVGIAPIGSKTLLDFVGALMLCTFFTPFFFVTVWKAALLAVVIGELLGRNRTYYILAGAVVCYVSALQRPNLLDPNWMAVAGLVAGHMFWLVREKVFGSPHPDLS